MAYLHVKAEHREQSAPPVLITAFRVGPDQITAIGRCFIWAPVPVRMRAEGDWVVSQPNEEPVVMLHETFLRITNRLIEDDYLSSRNLL